MIIVNDGSIDRSEEIAKKYVDKYPRKFKLINQNNAGLGGARNTGIKNAKGDYYFFVDSDDTISSNAVQILYEEASRNNADIVVFDYKLISEDGTELGITPGNNNICCTPNLKDSKSVLLINPSACNKFFKSALFTDSGIRFPIKVWYEDLRTIPKLLCKSENIVYKNEPLYNYLQRPGSIMNSKNIERNKEIIEALDDLLLFFKKNHLYDYYKEELEFLAVFHILLLGSVRVNKLRYNHYLMDFFCDYIVNSYPNYKKNKYIKKMSKKELLTIELLARKKYRLLNVLLRIKARLNF